MKKYLVYLSIAFLLILILLLAFPVAAFHERTKPLQRFSDGSIVQGSWSSLRTTDKMASFHLHTSELTSLDAITVWWVVFNHPENCIHGNLGFRCGEGDLFKPDVEASVIYGDGHIVRSEKNALSFNGRLKVGDDTRALFGNGLTNPRGADIHFVVRSHGPRLKYLFREQITTFGGGCNNPDIPPGTGVQGPNTCVDLQFSVHEQTL